MIDKEYTSWGTVRKKKEEKWVGPQRNVGHYSLYQHICNSNIGRKGEKGEEKIWEIIAEKLFYLLKNKNLCIWETQWIPSRINEKRTIKKHIIVNMSKVKGKEKKLKAAREKSHFIGKGTLIKLIAYFSEEIAEVRRLWASILNMLKEKKKNCLV